MNSITEIKEILCVHFLLPDSTVFLGKLYLVMTFYAHPRISHKEIRTFDKNCALNCRSFTGNSKSLVLCSNVQSILVDYPYFSNYYLRFWKKITICEASILRTRYIGKYI